MFLSTERKSMRNLVIFCLLSICFLLVLYSPIYKEVEQLQGKIGVDEVERKGIKGKGLKGKGMKGEGKEAEVMGGLEMKVKGDEKVRMKLEKIVGKGMKGDGEEGEGMKGMVMGRVEMKGMGDEEAKMKGEAMKWKVEDGMDRSDKMVIGWEVNVDRDPRLYVQPENMTAIIAASQLCQNSTLVLLVIICSAAHNFEKRSVIRDTWASNVGPDAKIAFLLGHNNDVRLQARIEKESRLRKDVIQENFIDTYNNLTVKSLMMLKWTQSYCNTARFLLKSDDDSFVNVPSLVELLKSKRDTNLLLGSLFWGAHPVKDLNDKWYMPNYLYRKKIYPNYLSGAYYVMSYDVVRKLYQTALKTPLIHIEDVYLTEKDMTLHTVDNLHKTHTLSSFRRTVYSYFGDAPRDYLDLCLTSCYQHNKELFPLTSDVHRQKETIGLKTWRKLYKEKNMAVNNPTKSQIVYGGVTTKRSIHSVKLGIGANHIAQTNAGFSRKLDGTYYGV